MTLALATKQKTTTAVRDSAKEVMVEGLNKRKTYYRFTKEDTAYIIKRRKELESEGKNDNQTAKIIAKEKHWNAGSVKQKIRQFVKQGKLQENPNKRITIQDPRLKTENGLLSALSRAALAMEKFGGEGE